MKNLIFTLSLVFLFCACKSLQLSNFPKGYALNNKIPALDTHFDVYSFAPDYADIYDIPNVLLEGSTPTPENVIRNITTEITISHDTRYIFEREIRRNISESTGAVKGFAVCRKGMRTKGIKSYLHPIVSVVTLGVVNLFGFPYAYLKDELEIMVDIYDNEDNIVGSYAALGTGEAKMAMYSGYSKTDAKRLAHARAFVQAMAIIKDQINDEHEKLSTELIK